MHTHALMCVHVYTCMCHCVYDSDACFFPSAAQDFSQSGFSVDPLTMFVKTMNYTWGGGGGGM